MKSTSKILGTLILTIMLTSCSTVKVINTWNESTTPNLKDKCIMVIGSTDDNIVRRQFENDLIEKLEKNGIYAMGSSTIFPKIDTSVKLSDTEIQKITSDLKNRGIEMIMVTVLKDTQEYTKTETTGGTSVRSFPGIWYHRGFYYYYNSFYIESEPMNTITYTGKKYILETVVYDLTMPDKQQLVSVITTETDNPKSIETISKDFSKRIVHELVN
ncbi:hypothetical protein [Flavivirga rizhaonensis]|uniref:DUF4136 domain-containing protein n=1 Tax=Flavivirga rizhaonensis TaxID=2559571 RepID=A0A4S1DZ85_9FLAO|nr:hypothetical protein [Flavivirga rizhaonensis]TGV03530.1 hypothetical protein EM932_05735 [Flavivirga rizhaonensis]